MVDIEELKPKIVEALMPLKPDKIILFDYPNPNYCLPPKEEIKNVLNFTEELFDKVRKILNIDKNEIE